MDNMNPINKWSILMIMVVSTFMSALDSSIVNVALPKMAKTLSVTTASIQLVSTSYLIMIVGSVLIFGKLGDILGKTKVFKFGLGLFTLGSLLCGMTDTFSVLIIARIIQATGAAGIMANSQGIITEFFPKNERGKALGLTGTSVALGSLIGPGLGGVLVGTGNWELIFLVNVPIGLVALFYAIKVLPQGNCVPQGKLDIPGSILFVLSIVPFFIALNATLERGFMDPLVLTGFLVSLVSVIVFLKVEKNQDNPLLHFQLFSNKQFSLSILCGFITFVALFCNNIILPFYLQDVMLYTPQRTGLILMAFPLILAFVAPISGHLSDRMGSEGLTFIGLSLLSGGLMMMTTLSEGSILSNMLLYIGIMAVGMGLFQSPNNALIMSTVEKDQLGIAGSINALIRNLGMVCGIVLATTILYAMMSARAGYQVTDVIRERSDLFIYGMKGVYLTAGWLSFGGAAMTFLRMMQKTRR